MLNNLLQIQFPDGEFHHQKFYSCQYYYWKSKANVIQYKILEYAKIRTDKF